MISTIRRRARRAIRCSRRARRRTSCCLWSPATRGLRARSTRTSPRRRLRFVAAQNGEQSRNVDVESDRPQGARSVPPSLPGGEGDEGVRQPRVNRPQHRMATPGEDPARKPIRARRSAGATSRRAFAAPVEVTGDHPGHAGKAALRRRQPSIGQDIVDRYIERRDRRGVCGLQRVQVSHLRSAWWWSGCCRLAEPGKQRRHAGRRAVAKEERERAGEAAQSAGVSLQRRRTRRKWTKRRRSSARPMWITSMSSRPEEMLRSLLPRFICDAALSRDAGVGSIRTRSAHDGHGCGFAAMHRR